MLPRGNSYANLRELRIRRQGKSFRTGYSKFSMFATGDSLTLSAAERQNFKYFVIINITLASSFDL